MAADHQVRDIHERLRKTTDQKIIFRDLEYLLQSDSAMDFRTGIRFSLQNNVVSCKIKTNEMIKKNTFVCALIGIDVSKQSKSELTELVGPDHYSVKYVSISSKRDVRSSHLLRNKGCVGCFLGYTRDIGNVVLAKGWAIELADGRLEGAKVYFFVAKEDIPAGDYLTLTVNDRHFQHVKSL